jgi:Tol biopolymer transport system component
VFLAPLSRSAGKLIVGEPRNISTSPGYDNQPFFTPDGRSVLFTSARGPLVSKCGSPQTDIYRYGIAEGRLTQVTGTADCEYSPTVMPDGTGFSVIQVEPDGTQRLWRFGTDGKNPAVVLENVKPVGYHAWLDDRRLVLFVLGQPATLQLADVSTGTAEVVASNVGQSIVRMPGGGVSFVQQEGENSDRTLTITQVTIENGKPVLKPLTAAVPGARQAHLAWTPDGTLLMAHDGSLHAWRAGQSGWQVVADLNALGLRNVTRIAVSPKGNWLALVAQQDK